MKKPKSARKKFFKIFLVIFLLILLPSLTGLTRATIACQPWNAPETRKKTDSPQINQLVKDIPDYYREEEKTYLTLPEWYIVYSIREYADFIENNSPSNFPYLKSANQYWQSYVDSCQQVKGNYPFNSGHQFTLVFIGLSFTTENMLKGVYETTIGRIYDLISSTETEEEKYAVNVAREYADFLYQTPWYFFPFKEKLVGLWQDTSLIGSNLLRKWERKNFLTLEYGGKALYAGFTNWGAKATYGGADTEKVHLVVRNLKENMKSSEFEVVREDGNLSLIKATRFQYFSEVIPNLVRNGLEIEEVAGNKEILITIIADRQENYNLNYSKYLFELPILTKPHKTRLAYKVKFSELKNFLSELEGKPGFNFEHMYDY